LTAVDACCRADSRLFPNQPDGECVFCLDAKPANFIFDEKNSLLWFVDTFMPMTRGKDGELEMITLLNKLKKNERNETPFLTRLLRNDSGFSVALERIGTPEGLFLKFALESMAALTHNPKYRKRPEHARDLVEHVVCDFMRDEFGGKVEGSPQHQVLELVAAVMDDDYRGYLQIACDGEAARFTGASDTDDGPKGLKFVRKSKKILQLESRRRTREYLKEPGKSVHWIQSGSYWWDYVRPGFGL